MVTYSLYGVFGLFVYFIIIFFYNISLYSKERDKEAEWIWAVREMGRTLEEFEEENIVM